MQAGGWGVYSELAFYCLWTMMNGLVCFGPYLTALWILFTPQFYDHVVPVDETQASRIQTLLLAVELSLQPWIGILEGIFVLGCFGRMFFSQYLERQRRPLGGRGR